jgi:hypothetical protein
MLQHIHVIDAVRPADYYSRGFRLVTVLPLSVM